MKAIVMGDFSVGVYECFFISKINGIEYIEFNPSTNERMTVKDFIEHAKKKNYDAIVYGERALIKFLEKEQATSKEARAILKRIYSNRINPSIKKAFR